VAVAVLTGGLFLLGVPIVTAAVGTPAATSATRCGDSGTPAAVALQDSHFYIDSASTALLCSG
jgi:L,D-peptidoglycan transpeptidase YkuD (ErfK/YbiS/YcfS/YnhG family)